MDRTMTRRSAVLAAFGVFGVITVVSVAPALAAFPDDNVKTYTGCLTGGGNVNYVKEGDSPSQPCSSPKNVVKLSGGDITKVTVTGALTGGGVNGAVTIGLDPAKTVPSGCTSGQVPKWSTSGIPAAWACGNDNDTTYAAGAGLDLTGTTFSVDPDAFLAGTGLSKSGTTFNVRPDAFSAGTGLDRVGTTFSVEPDAFTKKNQGCTTGSFVTGSDGNGTLTCGTPTSTLPVFHATTGSEVFDDNARVTKTMANLALPAGTWGIALSAVIDNLDGDRQSTTCEVTGATAAEGGLGTFVEPAGLQYAAGTVYAKVSLGAATTLPVTCDSFNSIVDVSVSATQVQ